ncbi:MAG: TMEM165/GDT1 family protein [Leptospiraceae bacterium]|nr:TMEM165/GDT1 family protein [Leptospiraceae bacterium]
MWKVFFMVFISVFLAEVGDKTQLATMVFAARENSNPWVVFLGSALALITASAIAVLVGSYLDHLLSPRVIKIGAGTLFIIIGIWTIFSK